MKFHSITLFAVVMLVCNVVVFGQSPIDPANAASTGMSVGMDAAGTAGGFAPGGTDASQAGISAGVGMGSAVPMGP